MGRTPDMFFRPIPSGPTTWRSTPRKTGGADLLGNRLVIIVPAESTLKLRTPRDLAAETVKHLAVGDPASVPVGKYAKRAMEKLGLWDQLKSKIVAGADVRQALAYVETGEAEAGIVYATDAAISRKVKAACDISEKLTGPVRYPLVLFDPRSRPRGGRVVLPLPGLSGGRQGVREAWLLCPSGRPRRETLMLTVEESTALRLSLQVAVCATLAGMPFAIAAGYVLARWKIPGKWLFGTALNLPLVLPPVVVGYLLLTAFAPRGPLGGACSHGSA